MTKKEILKLLTQIFYAIKSYEQGTGRSVINETLYFKAEKVVEDAISKNTIPRSTG